MNSPLLELEGTAEEIRAQLPDFDGRRLHVTVRTLEQETEAASNGTSHRLTITERIVERFRDTPPEERAKVPLDLTENLDHYIYGLPKKGAYLQRYAPMA